MIDDAVFRMVQVWGYVTAADVANEFGIAEQEAIACLIRLDCDRDGDWFISPTLCAIPRPPSLPSNVIDLEYQRIMREIAVDDQVHHDAIRSARLHSRFEGHIACPKHRGRRISAHVKRVGEYGDYLV